MTDERPVPESAAKTLLVSLAVCLVCSFVVSAAAVWLRPLQRANLERRKTAEILDMLRAQPGLSELLGGIDAAAVETRMVDLERGVEVADVDPATYDLRAASVDPAQSVALPADRDPARIGRRPRLAPVHLVRHEGRLRAIILPIYGRGYGGMIHGYLALEGDANTVSGVSFYEHAETPGIGAAITGPTWRGRWSGKRLRDAEGALRIRVVDAKTPEAAGDALHRVDAISGATRSSQGVGHMVRFWTGPDGFGPYLEGLRR